MKFKRSLLIPVLCCALLSPGCNKKPVTDPTQPGPAPATEGAQIIRTVKIAGIAVEAAVDEGVRFEAELGEGELDPVFRQKLHDMLDKAKVGIGAFNVRAQKYTTFDATAKGDVVKLAKDIVGFLEQVNEAGLLGIKNPAKQQQARRILAGAKLLARGFEVYSQATAQ